jgi:uridine monophosphate synthetase
VVRDLVILIDREQGGRERLAEKGYTLHAILTISQCFDELARVSLVEAPVIARAREFVRVTRFA